MTMVLLCLMGGGYQMIDCIGPTTARWLRTN